MSQSQLQSRSCTCSSPADDTSSYGSGTGAGEIMLFGVRVKVDPMRKSVSMNNLSEYEQPEKVESCNNNLDTSAIATVAAVDNGYATADDAVRTQSNGRERKRGIPWTEDEHKLFILGLQKVGKGDWRGISRNFVKTRTPTQVASHAQKYFLRRSNLNRRRRRSSLFDITIDSVAAMPTEEHQVKEDNNGEAVLNPSMASTQQIPPINGGSSSKPLIFPTLDSSTRMDFNLNQKYEMDPFPVSLNLSLSYDPDRSSSSSSYQGISGFKNGDSMISVN